MPPTSAAHPTASQPASAVGASLYAPRAERSVPALTRSTPASRTGSSLWPAQRASSAVHTVVEE